MTTRLLIWDWNGTLLDDVDICVGIMNVSLGKRAMPLLTRERYLALFQFPVINYYREIGFDFARESFKDVGREFIDAYEPAMFTAPLHAGAREVLAAVTAQGIAQNILSALEAGALQRIVDHFSLRPHFPQIHGADDAYAHGKVECGRALVRECGVPPAEVVMIGDTHHDAEVAAAMGVRCVLFSGGHNARSRLVDCGVPVIDDLRRVLDYL